MPPRMTKAGQSARTQRDLIAAGRALFAERGYEGVSAEEIAAAAGVTTGALYHQFRNKRDLFSAVFEAVEQDLTLALMAAGGTATDPLDQFVTVCNRFLESAREPDVRRIVILEGRTVLGWDAWHETMAKYGLGMTRSALGALMATGTLRTLPLDALAHLVLGALTEGAALIAEAEDPATTQGEVSGAFAALMEGLRP